MFVAAVIELVPAVTNVVGVSIDIVKFESNRLSAGVPLTENSLIAQSMQVVTEAEKPPTLIVGLIAKRVAAVHANIANSTCLKQLLELEFEFATVVY